MMTTVVAVHGNGGGAHRFSLAALHVPTDVSFTAVTLPGFADRPRDPSLRTLREYAGLLAAIVHEQPRPRVVLGHGIGGSIALELIQEHASAIDGLILHAPVGARLERRWFPQLMAVPGARELGRRLFASRVGRPLFRRLLFSAAVPVAFTDRFFDEYGQCTVFGQMFDLITARWFRGLRPSDVPAGLLWGEAERVLTIDQLDDYRALLPATVIRRVPGWGHFPMIETPAAYAAEVAALARKLVGAHAASPSSEAAEIGPEPAADARMPGTVPS